MGSLATVLVLIGPFLAGAALGSVPMSRLARLILAASLPAILITWYRGTSHNPSDTVTLIGAIDMIGGGWLFGFVGGEAHPPQARRPGPLRCASDAFGRLPPKHD